ncbi:MAG: TetR family transcriptional regulator [Novosphingobium sp.]|nr:TetR family transcriptional regulator [Novosphingobium sp.]
MATDPLLNEAPGGPRQAILNAAIRLFGKQGYTGTSMRDIANEVGVLPGSLYAHIQSKEALLVEIVADGIGRFLGAIRSHVDAGATSKERLRRMIIAHLEVVADNPERSLVVFHQWRFLSEANLPEAIERRRAYEKAFIDVIQAGVDAGEFRARLDKRLAVFTILGALNWAPEWYSPQGKLGPREIGETIADTLISGITD